MKQAVIYGRVSSDRQEKEGFSLPAQEKLIKKYAIEKNITIAESFFEAETAKRAGRKKFNEMIKFLKKHKDIKTILVEKTDRLYRNLKDYVLLDEIDGLEIHFVKEGTILNENSRSQDKFMHGIRVLMAKNYIDNLSEEIRKGLSEKAEQGYCPTKAPFGYKNITQKDGKRIIVPDAATAHFIKKAYELYSTGVFTYKGIAKLLSEEGFYPNNKKCTKRVIEVILKNPFYTGVFEYKGKRYEEGKHEPLISKELFYTVQKLKSENNAPRPQIHNFTYLGLIKCSKCGCQLTAEIKKGKYIYYHCTGNKGGDCKKNYIREAKIEKAFEELIKQITFSKEEIKEIMELLKHIYNQQEEDSTQSLEALNKRIKLLKSRIQKLYEDRADGIIEDEFYFNKKNQWQNELDEILIKYNSTLRVNRTFLENAETLFELCKNAHSAYLRQTPSEKIKMLKLVCSNFLFDGKNIIAQAFPPFDVIIKKGNFKKLESGCQCSNIVFIKELAKSIMTPEFSILSERIKIFLAA